MSAHPPGEDPSPETNPTVEDAPAATPETDPPVEGDPPETASAAPKAAVERPAAKTTRERAEAKRQEKLDFVREQVANGSLVIREMTEDERQKYPPSDTPPRRKWR